MSDTEVTFSSSMRHMLTDNEKDKIISIKKLSDDKDFFNNVFKKTEKIVSVVFYILTYLPHTELSLRHENNVSEKAFAVHEVSIRALTVHRFEAGEALSELLQALVALESSLRIAASAGLISNDALFLIVTEIDSVTRTVNNHYLASSGPAPLPESVTSGRSTGASTRSKAVSAPSSGPAPARSPGSFTVTGQDMSSDAARVKAAMPDRTTRIKTVLEAAGEASIKDISDVIRDCSEKTIQRELNNLIEKGEVIRMGERRWSRYSVLK